MCLNLITLLDNVPFERAYEVQKLLLTRRIYSTVIPLGKNGFENHDKKASVRILKEDLSEATDVLNIKQ